MIVPSELLGTLGGAVILGAIHGVEPGHGWPVAASYALDRSNKWLYGFAASLLIGVGHLVSSIAMVMVFFYAKAYFDLAQVNEPLTVLGDIQIGGPVSLIAGVLLIALGIREYRHGHAGHAGGDHEGVGHNHSHDHGHSDHQHHPDGGDAREGLWARLTARLPGGGADAQTHASLEEPSDRGLLGIAWFAFVLGFAHEEEFEIIALCAGSTYCLELMLAYALTVIIGIVALTMLLIAGYQNFEERVERYVPYLPAFSAAVLILMGVGFIAGLF